MRGSQLFLLLTMFLEQTLELKSHFRLLPPITIYTNILLDSWPGSQS